MTNETSAMAPGWLLTVEAAALKAAGLPPIHFHDLRHTGNTLAAGSGANLRELMGRVGHASARAAMLYLHGSYERQQAIAESRKPADELGRSRPGSSGRQRARQRRKAS